MKKILALTIIAAVGVGLLAVAPGSAAAEAPELDITAAADGETELGVEEPPLLTDVLGSPYESVSIDVGIERDSGARDVADTVIEALEYWENNSQTYAGYPVKYELVENDSDLRIRLQESVTACGVHSGEFSGCADVVGDQAPAQVFAEIETSQTDRGVFETAVHEIGHTLGLTHDDDPQYYMNKTAPHPWERETAGVYLDFGGSTEDVITGLEWLSANTDSVRSDFRESNDRGVAIVVETMPDACEEGFIACAEWSEIYTDQVIIKLDTDADSAARDWYVASFIAEFAREFPEVLEPDTPQEVRTSDWWN